jgi:hypothetical protein
MMAVAEGRAEVTAVDVTAAEVELLVEEEVSVEVVGMVMRAVVAAGIGAVVAAKPPEWHADLTTPGTLHLARTGCSTHRANYCRPTTTTKRRGPSSP